MNEVNCSESGEQKASVFGRLVMFLLRPKVAELWHPESPGKKVTITRTWLGRLVKPACFATLGECMKSGIYWKGMNDSVHCPVCGHET